MLSNNIHVHDIFKHWDESNSWKARSMMGYKWV